MKDTVSAASHAKHTTAIDALHQMQSLQSLIGLLTAAVFLLGLLLAALLASVTRGHRRLLDSERARAVDASRHDSLTGLGNHRLLTERMAAALAADGTGMAGTGLLLLDLDHFTEINDTFGHHYGDGLLMQGRAAV